MLQIAIPDVFSVIGITILLIGCTYFFQSNMSTIPDSNYPLIGAFFTEVSEFPALTIFVHKSKLNGRNPLPLNSPKGIKDNYYFIGIFDKSGSDRLGQIPPEVFIKLYKRGYDISSYSPIQLVKIFEDIRSATKTIFTNDQLVANEKYFKERIAFAREQLRNI